MDPTVLDSALVADVLPNPADVARDLGVSNIAGAHPFTVAPAIARAILAISNESYSLLYAVAGVSVIIGATRSCR